MIKTLLYLSVKKLNHDYDLGEKKKKNNKLQQHQVAASVTVHCENRFQGKCIIY